MKFEGEFSRGGVPLCGETFMAGTICSLEDGHPGAHGTDCVDCGGDWLISTCVCVKYCEDCGTSMELSEKGDLCEDCVYNRERCQAIEPKHGWGRVRGDEMIQCDLKHDHEGEHEFYFPPFCYCQLCKGSSSRPVSDEEVAEAFGLPVEVVRRGAR